MRTPLLVLTGFVLVTALSCFSDRTALGPTGDEPDCNVPGQAIGSDNVVVFVRRFTFFPDTVRIRPGMSVTWVNCEAANIEPHTSTSTTDAWDSGPFGPGTAYTRTFTSGGSFSYFCRPHPTMTGVILVN
jgi:plastocyanin